MMNMVTSTVLLSLIATALFGVTVVEGAAGKFVDVSVTLRGKKYDVPHVSTVSEVQSSVEELSGLAASKQGVLFGGQKLRPADVLEDVGIEDGSVINIVPSSKKKKTTSSSSSSGSSASKVANVSSSSSSSGGSSTATDPMSMMDDMLKSAGVDTQQLQDMLQGMGGADGKPPDMMQTMEMMQKMMSSPMFKDFMNDPARLEQGRQMILGNPMMKSMMASLPGFDEIINDREKWRETMVAAASMYQNMGPDMMKAMASMSGGMMDGLNMPGMPSMPGSSGGGGGFGLPDVTPAFAGLDELSEGED